MRAREQARAQNKRATQARLNERRDEVAFLTRQGYSIAKIAKVLGIQERVVSRDRQIAGVSQDANKPWSEEKKLAIEAMLDDGVSYREISRTLGVNEDYLSDKYPGRGWTKQQIWEYSAMLKKYTTQGTSIYNPDLQKYTRKRKAF